jgi:hypothetical protein
MRTRGGTVSTRTTEIWTYSGQGWNRTDDIVGYKVEAIDGSIGKVDKATYDISGSYIAVDTGPWIFGKKVLLPAGVLERVDRDDEKVYINRTRDQIKNAPEFDQDRLDEPYRTELGTYYDRGGRASREPAKR